MNDVVVVAKILTDAGFNAKEILKCSTSDATKKKLQSNTLRAVQNGVCGVPSFQINDGEVIWGQDKFDVIGDLLCGWDGKTPGKSKFCLTCSKI